MSEEEDEVLFGRYRQGDMRAFDCLYARYRQSLFLYLLRTFGSRSEAEDLYHDCWSRVISASEPFTQGLFRAYLFKIARHLSIDHQRKQRLRVVGSEDSLAAEATAPSAEKVHHDQTCQQQLLAAIKDLPQLQRDVFLLKEESNLTLEAIASLLAVGRETIKSRLRYAMQQLREKLQECL
ncbi:MAG: sigma-70 family RNA polymerase sigma factor [Gammaproteobacteria bacterium]|nr:sigma-70 family RNA polymerase sigma factor [Gammaproteobacteria bacterium]